jgi:membrane protease YdiL (CAAX protease family)
MTTQIDVRRVLIFLAVACGLSWGVALVIYLNGWNTDPLMLAPGVPITTVLIAGIYMPAPALANVLTRLITREGWGETWLRLNFRKGWLYWLIAWLLPGIFTIIGGALYYAVFSDQFDASMPVLRQQLAALGRPQSEAALQAMIIGQTALAFTAAPFINGLFTFGEEFGWRAYLQHKLMPLGWRPAMLWMGLIWGLWHWPLTVMGHNYGLDYPGYPYAGIAMMCLFTFTLGTIEGWLVIKAGSVWPAVIAHAAINGIAALPALFVATKDVNTLLGPAPAGILAMLPFLILALFLFFRPGDLGDQSSSPL